MAFLGAASLPQAGTVAAGGETMRPTVQVQDSTIVIETDQIGAEVHTEGYTTGVAAGTFVDKATGARDLGWGLDIVDFLLEPGPDDDSTPAEHRYVTGDLIHGNLQKRYVELPQICTQAKKVQFEVVEGEDFVAVRQWFRYTEATRGRKAGSLWEQWLVFPAGRRYFLASDTITSVNDVDQLILRIDMPGHVKHHQGHNFREVYLSYHGLIPAAEFLNDFAPDERFLYQRGRQPMPERMIRAYHTRLDGRDGPWLAGMTLDPEAVYEAWCHQRGYVCFIQEIGGFHVPTGGQFGAAYVVGYFDSIEDMEQVYDQFRGAQRLVVSAQGYELLPKEGTG
jgi:hypothetical protein